MNGKTSCWGWLNLDSPRESQVLARVKDGVARPLDWDLKSAGEEAPEDAGVDVVRLRFQSGMSQQAWSKKVLTVDCRPEFYAGQS